VANSKQAHYQQQPANALHVRGRSAEDDWNALFDRESADIDDFTPAVQDERYSSEHPQRKQCSVYCAASATPAG
jgi:hypothetical protein